MTALEEAPDAARRALALSDADARELSGTFVNELDFDFVVSDDGTTVSGRAGFSETMCVVPGLVRPSVLGTIADCVAGVPAMLASRPRLSVTLDLMVRLVSTRLDPELEIAADIVKRGTTTVATEVRFLRAGTEEIQALSYFTFAVSPRPQDQAPPTVGSMHVHGTMPEPFPDRVGMRTLTPGVAEIDRRPFVRQASNSIQGGVVALLGERAAETLTGHPVVELDTRYLTGVRVGPARATAVELGDGAARVEVRDVGNDDRLTALIYARVDPGIDLPSGD